MPQLWADRCFARPRPAFWLSFTTTARRWTTAPLPSLMCMPSRRRRRRRPTGACGARTHVRKCKTSTIAAPTRPHRGILWTCMSLSWPSARSPAQPPATRHRCTSTQPCHSTMLPQLIGRRRLQDRPPWPRAGRALSTSTQRGSTRLEWNSLETPTNRSTCGSTTRQRH